MIVEDYGLIVTDGTEQELFVQQTVLDNYATSIFLNTLSIDDIDVIAYDYDTNDATEKIYDKQTFKGVQDSPDIHIPYLPSIGYRVSIQQNYTPLEEIIVTGFGGVNDVVVTDTKVYAVSTNQEVLNEYNPELNKILGEKQSIEG